MSGSTAIWDANGSEVGSATSSQERGITSKEGHNAGETEETVSLTKISERVPQKELKMDKIQNQIKLRGAKGCTSGDGENAEEKKEEIEEMEGEEEEIGPLPPPIL